MKNNDTFYINSVSFVCSFHVVSVYFLKISVFLRNIHTFNITNDN